MVFNATFSNISVISWRSVLLVEKTRVPGENHLNVMSILNTHMYIVKNLKDKPAAIDNVNLMILVQASTSISKF